jgi:hypothetical protein
MKFFGALLLIASITPSGNSQMAPTMTRNKMGFFVLTNGTYTGVQVTNATCLSDLNGNPWKGKDRAGTLTSGRVRAFICDDSSCNNPSPNSYYTFAVSGSPTLGGAVFVTNSIGRGPGNTKAWDDDDHFGTTIQAFWTGPRATQSASFWRTDTTGATNSCDDWGSNSFGDSGRGGTSAGNDETRWNSFSSPCWITLRIICLVEPK